MNGTEVRPIIRTVTVTGADDSVRPEDLVTIQKDYPFLEFGILLSSGQQGSSRFPSADWLEKLHEIWLKEKLVLSAHLCGKWVKDLCLGVPSFFEEFKTGWEMFERYQLNFQAENHFLNEARFLAVIGKYLDKKPIIFLAGEENDHVFFKMEVFIAQCSVLFDLSGGAGILPQSWPRVLRDFYCGYAGGLSPDNLQSEMQKIAQMTSGNEIWIDAETWLRSGNDKIFDLDKVCDFAEKAKPWVIQQAT